MTAVIQTSVQLHPIQNQCMNWLCHKLKLKSKKIDEFFLKEANGELDKINIQIKRAAHWIFNGIWIDQAKVGRLINEHRFSQGDYADEKIKEIIENVLGKGFYEKSLQEAMEESPAEFLANRLTFLKEFLRSPFTVGAILPSSSHLSKAITKDIQSVDSTASSIGRRILEVGPGTGIFTREIIRHLRPNDHLDLIEYDEKFCNILRGRFGHLPNVQIHHISITDFKSEERKYDFIISGLPLNAFESSFVKQIYDKFEKVIKIGGRLAYFEYLGLPKIKEVFLLDNQKEDARKVLKIKKNFFEENIGRSENIWLNAPPAKVCKCIYGTG